MLAASMRSGRRVLACVLVSSLCVATARAQDRDLEREASEEPAPLPEIETVPLPEPEPEPDEVEPDHEERSARPPLPILERVGGRPHRAEDGERRATAGTESAPPDVAFVVPMGPQGAAGDLRANTSNLRLPGQNTQPAPPYGISAAAGFTRQLAMEPIDYVRVEERFEARIPGFSELRLGVGSAQMINSQYFVIEAGPRVGMGAYFCDTPEMKCEGIIDLQPGVAFGSFGVLFDLNASLDLRLQIERVFEVGVSGAFSFIGDGTFLSLGGMLGVTF